MNITNDNHKGCSLEEFVDFDLEELGHFLDQVEPGNQIASNLKGKKGLSNLVTELKFLKGFN